MDLHHWKKSDVQNQAHVHNFHSNSFHAATETCQQFQNPPFPHYIMWQRLFPAQGPSGRIHVTSCGSQSACQQWRDEDRRIQPLLQWALPKRVSLASLQKAGRSCKLDITCGAPAASQHAGRTACSALCQRDPDSPQVATDTSDGPKSTCWILRCTGTFPWDGITCSFTISSEDAGWRQPFRFSLAKELNLCFSFNYSCQFWR